jgi:MFS family permease
MILWTGETVSALGSSMSFFVFPLIGYAITGSAAQAALAVTGFTLGSVIAQLPAGVLVDRWNRRTVMLLASAAGCLLYASLGVALVLGVLTLAHLVAVGLLAGVASSLFQPAEHAALRAVVPPEQLPTAFSQNQARQHVASLVGPPVGGLLYAATRWAPFLVDAVSFGLSALAISRIRTPLAAPPREDGEDARGALRSLRTDVREGFGFLMSRGFLRALLAFAAVANFAVKALFLVLTLKLLQAGVSPAAIGLIEAIAAVAGILGALAAPTLIRRLPTGLLSIGTSLVIVLAIIPMAFTNNVWVIGALLALGLFGNPAGNAAISAYMAAITPDRMQGRANAALIFCATSLSPLGPLVGGALLVAWGGQQAMLAMALLAAFSVLPLVLSGETRRLPRPDRWQAILEQ